MNGSLWLRCLLVVMAVGLLSLCGCPGPSGSTKDGDQRQSDGKGAQGDATAKVAQQVATAKAEDVNAAKALLDELGNTAEYTLLPGNFMTAIVIRDGSTLSAEDIALFGRLTDLETLQILNYRAMNDEIAAQISDLPNLTTLALTNSVINDDTVELIVKSFPELTNLDLSSNTNMTNTALKAICELSKLERLTLVQNGFNDVGTGRLSKLTNLKVLDLRGNMNAGDMTMEILGVLPSLAVLKHRSTTVSDFGVECLVQSKTLKALLMQDFKDITSQAGQHLARIESLSELEIFRCEGFGSEGVLALKGMKLTRLKLRGLPMVDDQAMVTFEDLPELRRLNLHELDSISDEGLKNLGALKTLEVLDIWSVPQMTDATVDVIATLPNIKELSIRITGVTDAAIDQLLAMPKLQSLTFKENGSVTDEGLKKLSAGKKWAKLDLGAASQ